MSHAHEEIAKHRKRVIKGVYNKTFTPNVLPLSMYLATANMLKTGLYKGFGAPLQKFQYNSPDHKMLYELRNNVYMFSGAKTFQQTLAMSEALTDGNRFVSFDEFEQKAGDIFDTYNDNWLNAEYNTAIGQARSASKWADISSHKNELPYLIYVAVMDEHTCDICAPLDGICLPVDDPFWLENMPLNHFNCECTVEQVDEDEGGEKEWEDNEVEEAVKDSHETKNPLFNMNPGVNKEVFKSTGKTIHPYFKIPQAYRALAQKNFNLPIPERD